MMARIERLARVLGVTLHPAPFVTLYRGRDRRWRLAAVEGDQLLPMTSGCVTAPEALDAAEAWLAPEIDRMEAPEAPPVCDRCGCTYGPRIGLRCACGRY